ncbi:MAG: hypothetical protein K1V99_03055 [Bacteroidales bacterium]
MSDTKIFSLGDQGGSNSMAGLIASLCQNRGLDPNMVMAMMNNNRGYGGFGDMGAWWIIILLIFGWGGFGNGFGGGFNGRGTAQGLADLGNLVNNDAGRELIMSAIQGVGGSVSQLASTVHCDVNALQGAISSLSTQLCQLGNQMGQNTNQVLTAIMQGNNGLASQLCDCCCSLKNLVTTQGYENQLRTVQQTDDIKSDATAKFNVLSAKIDAQTQIINDKFCQLEMREMQRENQNLRDQLQAYQLSASQQTQTANIVSQLRPCPTPAYIVPNPFGCGCRDGYPYGGNCGNNGCGC